jgi:hypothetical protein
VGGIENVVVTFGTCLTYLHGFFFLFTHVVDINCNHILLVVQCLFGPQLQNTNKCAPLNLTFSVFDKWELNLEQTIQNKTQVLLGTSWGMHLGTL